MFLPAVRASITVTLVAAMVSALTAGSGLAQSRQPFVQGIPGTNLSLTMVLAPGGTFMMGSPEDEPGRDEDEGPQREVALEPFWITVHEVTHDQFAVFRYRRLDSEATATEGERFDVDAVSRPSPPYEDPAQGMGQGNHPATGMTQWTALQYARWLSLKTGRLFRLPTEAEWEYACRAGTTTAFVFGDQPDALGEHAWYAANSGDVFHPVGQQTPNAWGVYDMHGNVAEWTMDQYDEAAYGQWSGDPVPEPWTKPTSDHPRTVRGGAFDDDAAALRCADRLESTMRWKRRDPQLPKSRWWNTDSPHVGFRLVSPDRAYTMADIQAYWDELLGS